MLKNSNINLIMDQLYGEGDDNLDLSGEDQLELDELQEQLNFLDQWDVVETETEIGVNKVQSVEKDVLNLEEVASYLQLSETEVVSLLPDLPHVNLAGKYRFQLESIKEWLSSVEKNKVVIPKNNQTRDNIVNIQDFLIRNVI